MTERRITCDGKDIVFMIKRSRRRTVALRVEPSGAVTVYAPYFTWGPFIDRFVKKQTSWILKKLAHFKQLSDSRPRREFVTGARFPVWGAETPLEVVRVPGLAHPFCQTNGARLQAQIGAEHLDAAEPVKSALREWYVRQTEEKLPASIARNAPALGVSPRSVRVADQRSRWGSCSAKGGLRFSWRLAALPEEYLDYVVIHELAHLKVMSHSRRFWEVVASVCPDYKALRKRLRKDSLKFAWLD